MGLQISIHALQAESDDQKFANSSALLISIHALQAESDNDKIQIYHVVFLFQSTLSKRRATEIQVLFLGLLHYFNPRSPSGERRIADPNKIYAGQISIHALQAESDRYQPIFSEFLDISIHALQAESDI